MAETALLSQYLTFALGEELYAIDVADVREVLEMTPVTPIPRVPPYMRGVINVRGSVVPVVDLRIKFGMSRTDQSIHTCVVVLDLRVQGSMIVIGAIVDAVQEVIELEESQVDQVPRLGTGMETEFIRGIGKRDEKFIMILDIQRVFEEDELLEVAFVKPTS